MDGSWPVAATLASTAITRRITSVRRTMRSSSSAGASSCHVPPADSGRHVPNDPTDPLVLLATWPVTDSGTLPAWIGALAIAATDPASDDAAYLQLSGPRGANPISVL